MQRPLTLDRFHAACGAVAAACGVPPADLLLHTRTPYATRARLVLYAALHSAGWAYSDIGRRCGRDHSTVMNGVKSGAALIAGDPDYAAAARVALAAVGEVSS